MYGYTICEYERVKEGFPEFRATMEKLRTDLIAKAVNDWGPLTFGGMAPKSGQFGECPIMPALFYGQPGAQLTTWNQWFNTTGHQTILYGNATGNTIPEDYKIGLAGIAFLDKAIRVSEIKLQVGDKKIGRINIEEAFAYNKPVVVFENGLICDEEEGFDLYAYIRTKGPQRIKLLGPQLNRVPNKLQVSNTGAALS
jgi:hypothetical protein